MLMMLMCYCRGAVGMPGRVEGRLFGLSDGPPAAPGRHQRRGSVPLFCLRAHDRRFRIGRPGSAPPDLPFGPERRRYVQWTDVADGRIANPQTDQRYIQHAHGPQLRRMRSRKLWLFISDQSLSDDHFKQNNNFSFQSPNQVVIEI